MTFIKLQTKYGVTVWLNPGQICVVTEGNISGETFVWTTADHDDERPFEFAMSVDEFFNLLGVRPCN